MVLLNTKKEKEKIECPFESFTEWREYAKKHRETDVPFGERPRITESFPGTDRRELQLQRGRTGESDKQNTSETQSRDVKEPTSSLEGPGLSFKEGMKNE